MKETIDTISEELWQEIKELLQEKLLEFGVDESREEWSKAEISSKLIVKFENDYLTDN